MVEMSIGILKGTMIFVYLGISTYWDLRYKRIPWSVQGMGFIFLCICILVQWKELSLLYLVAFVPGICLLLLAGITGENIGYADGVSVMLLGGMIGFRGCIWMLCISMLLLSVFGLLMLLLKRMTRKSKIPYLPFLFLAGNMLMFFRIF